VSSSDWIIGNIQHSGFFRVNYDAENWKLLIDQLLSDNKKIHVVNRAVLIDDAFNLGKAELIDQLLYFNLTSYLQSEDSDLPFVPAFYSLNAVADLLVDSYETSQLFGKFYMNLLEKKYNETGWKNQNDPNLL
jgi:hypothetical protein